jgi:hypothetical protein
MLIQTRTVTVNSAFLEEIKQLNQALWNLLEAISLACTQRLEDEESRTCFCIRLTRLRDQLATHFSLEEAFGYLDGPIDIAPRLSDRADQLRLEHIELAERIAALVDFAWTLNERQRLQQGFRKVVREFDGFHAQLRSHERKEQMLIFQAYGDDIGCGD